MKADDAAQPEHTADENIVPLVELDAGRLT